MNNLVGVIVDGAGDYRSLKRRFPRGLKVLKTDGPRGHAATVNDIANKSKKQVGILKAFKCDLAIILIDFEERVDDYSSFIQQLDDAFSAIPLGIPVSVAVCNRMIENWYLADIEHISRNKVYIRDGLKQKNYEGMNGKNEIKKCMKRWVSYSETIHGPELFGLLRFHIARQNSASFDIFLKLIDGRFEY